VAFNVFSAKIGGAIQGTSTSTDTLFPARSVDACIAAVDKWALWSGGTCLRGANIWQTINTSYHGGTIGYNPFGPPFTQADFDSLAAMGANVVNIAHPGLYSETAPYVLNTDAQANLDSLIAMIQRANMFAVITFRTGPGRNESDIVPGHPGPELYSVWTSQAEQDAWVAMWRYTADRYKNNKVVVGYDLMCEPHSNAILPTPTYDPSSFYPTYANTLYDWNPLAMRITTAVRQVDNTTPILIGGMSWSSAYWLNSLTSNGDTKTVYMVHLYEPHTYTHQSLPITSTSLTYGTTTGSFTRTDLLTQFAYISSFKNSRQVPVGVNEFGVKRYETGASQYLNDEMEIMESNGLNYSIWEWASSYSGINWDDFNYRRGTDPNNHADVTPNELTTVIESYFQKNTVRPSNAFFQPFTTSYRDTVQKVYLAYYNRPADLAGMNYWAQRLYDEGGNMNNIINAFATSSEAVALYGTINSTTISSVVTIIYRNLFNRDPDPGGLDYYVNGFNTGSFTPGTIAMNILDGAQGNDLILINNVLDAANLVTF
jgi:hypothetical protein